MEKELLRGFHWLVKIYLTECYNWVLGLRLSGSLSSVWMEKQNSEAKTKKVTYATKVLRSLAADIEPYFPISLAPVFFSATLLCLLLGIEEWLQNPWT